MDDNRLTIDQELEDIRQQYSVLKARFDRQEIVTEKLMRNALRRKISTYNWINMYIPLIIIIPAVAGLFLIADRLHLPVWPCVAGAVISALLVLSEFLIRRKYKDVFCLDTDVRKAAHSAKEYKVMETRLLVFGSILVALYVLAAYYSWFSAIAGSSEIGLTSDPIRWVLFGLAISAIVAVTAYVSIIGLRIFDSLIKDLEE